MSRNSEALKWRIRELEELLDCNCDLVLLCGENTKKRESADATIRFGIIRNSLEDELDRLKKLLKAAESKGKTQ